MSLVIAQYSFDEIGKIESIPGLYTVVSWLGNEKCLIDVGQTDNLKSELRKIVLREDNGNGSDNMVITTYYTPGLDKAERGRIETGLRNWCSSHCKA